MEKIFSLPTALLFATFFLCAQAVSAQCNISQPSSDGFAGDSETMFGQTFTPTCNGTITAITFRSQSALGTVTALIRTAVCGGTTLFTSASQNVVSGVNTVTVSPAVNVTANTTYFLQLNSADAYNFEVKDGNPYAGGTMYRSTPSGNLVCANDLPAFDLVFSVTIGAPACTTPTAYAVTGTGTRCSNQAGLSIGLAGSETGVTYQLRRGGADINGVTANGTGSAITFSPAQTDAGTYTVVATRTVGGCTASMTGSAVVTVNQAPAAYAVTGTGTRCSNQAGLSIGLAGSETGVTYQLRRGGADINGVTANGTGSAITFSPAQTDAGTYTVVATRTIGGCTASMTGSAVVTVNQAPAVFNVTGGGANCPPGAEVGVSGSEVGIEYGIYLDGSNTPLTAFTGDGGPLSGLFAVAGTYTIVALNNGNGCTTDMTGSAVVTESQAPALAVSSDCAIFTGITQIDFTCLKEGKNAYQNTTGVVALHFNAATDQWECYQVSSGVVLFTAPDAGGSAPPCEGWMATLCACEGSTFSITSGCHVPSVTVSTSSCVELTVGDEFSKDVSQTNGRNQYSNVAIGIIYFDLDNLWKIETLLGVVATAPDNSQQDPPCDGWTATGPCSGETISLTGNCSSPPLPPSATLTVASSDCGDLPPGTVFSAVGEFGGKNEFSEPGGYSILFDGVNTWYLKNSGGGDEFSLLESGNPTLNPPCEGWTSIGSCGTGISFSGDCYKRSVSISTSNCAEIPKCMTLTQTGTNIDGDFTFENYNSNYTIVSDGNNWSLLDDNGNTLVTAPYGDTHLPPCEGWSEGQQKSGSLPPACTITLTGDCVPPCDPPTDPIISNENLTSANLSWTEGNVGQPVDIYLSTSTTDPDDSTTPTMEDASGPTTTLTGLSCNTTYYVWLRTDCSPEGRSQWVGPVSFTTLALAAPTISPNSASTCSGGTVELTATPPGGASIKWYDAPTSGTLLGSDNLLSVSPTVTTSYYAESVNGACTSTRTLVVVTVTSLVINIVPSSISACSGYNTSCTTDDTYTADVMVTFANKPGTGTFSLSGADIVTAVTPVDVNSIGINSYTFPGVTLRADGAAIGLTAAFSGGLACSATNSNVGTAPASCSNNACSISSVTVGNFSSCNNNGTGDGSDDTFTADVTVTFAYPPATGSLVLDFGFGCKSCLPITLGTVSVADLQCTTTHTFVGVVLPANSSILDVFASFTDASCLYPFQITTIAPCPYAQITDIQAAANNDCLGYNTTCATDDTYTANVTVYYTQLPASGFLTLSGADIVGASPTVAVGSAGATSHTFTGVTLRADGAAIDLTATFSAGGAGSTFNKPNAGTAPASCSNNACSVSDITLADPSGCINPGNTVTPNDDYFTANVTVNFTYAPGSGNLTLKRGSTVLATKLASELACVTSWTFTAVQMVADGAAVVLTAEFTGCTHTSSTLMTAPPPCSCVPPTFTACPTNQTPVNASAGLCSAVMTYTATADGSPASAITYVFAGATVGSGSGTGSGSAFNQGVTTVTLTATNPCGTPTCVFTITVNDTQNPSITCPSNISKNTDFNQCSAVVTYANPTFSDNCSGAFLTRTSAANTASGSVFPAGTSTMVNWKVTDASGNMAVCDFTVTVSDNQLPSISCPTNIVRNTDANQCSAVVTFATPTVTDNCAPTPTVVQTSGLPSGSPFPVGITQVKFKATDGAALTRECTFNVTVNDAQVPSIACPSNITQGNDAGQCHATITYAPPTYSDNCPGGEAVMQSGLPSGSNFPKGINTVVWKATDVAGLTKTCSFRVTVNDTQAPTITCPTVAPITTAANSCVSAPLTYSTPTATDNCAPAPTVVRISGPTSGSTFPLGATTVIWRAIDGAGRSSTCSFSVAVTDATLPSISCPGSIAVTGSGSPCTATVGYTAPTATDNCGLQSLFLLSGQPSGSSFPAGATVNTWRALDNSGGSATCSFTVTVGCGTSGQSNAQQSVAHMATDKPSTASKGLSQFDLLLEIYPNPAPSEVRFKVSGLEGRESELVVFDALGRTAMRQTISSEQREGSFDVSAWTEGFYQVVLRTEKERAVRRLMVIKE